MKKTGNYQLNLWEKSDRIQMEDFNADNMKTEQALESLAAEVAALKAANEALQGKAGLQLIREGNISSHKTGSMTISLSGIDWSQWKAVHVLADICCSSSFTIGPNNNASNCYFGTGVYNNTTADSGGTRTLSHLILLPMHRADRQISGVVLGSTSSNIGNIAFSSLSYLTLAFSSVHSDKSFAAGSCWTIWGEK